MPPAEEMFTICPPLPALNSAAALASRNGARRRFHNAIPNVGGQFIQPPKRNANVPCGIVHQHVQAIVFLTNGLDQSVDGLGISLIELHGFRAAAVTDRLRCGCRTAALTVPMTCQPLIPSVFAIAPPMSPDAPVTRAIGCLSSYPFSQRFAMFVTDLNCGLNYVIRPTDDDCMRFWFPSSPCFTPVEIIWIPVSPKEYSRS